jgi:FRG domain
MLSARVSSYRQLLDSIAALPPPAGGAVRVYRGQTKDYGTLLSSMGRIRQTRPEGEAFETNIRHWFIKSGMLTLVSDLLKLVKLSAIDVRIGVSDFVFAEALIQHYGYQTAYIDVTPSPDVALWFATHRFEGHMDAPYGAAPVHLTWPAWHITPTAPGVIYVLDVQPWDGVSAIQEGVFVDLLPIAPDGVNRPRRQAGGLLRADGDLYPLAGAKFEIDFPWQETGLDWSTDYIFPGPAEDPIYANLLRAPFFHAVRPAATGDGEEEIFRRACTLPEYCAGPGDIERTALYRSYDRLMRPTLYHPALMRRLDQLPADPGWFEHFRPHFERATPIMLQRPMILFTMRRGGPPPPPAAPPREVPPPFRNFFLEFAPENYAIEYDENRMQRGVWCCWMGDSEFLLQSFGVRAGRPDLIPFATYQWQPGRGLVCTNRSDGMGTYVTLPLELIQMTVDGLLNLELSTLGHGYFDLTTTDKFWPVLRERTDLF